MTHVKTSVWQACQGAGIVEESEKVGSCSGNAGRIETSGRETRQGTLLVETLKETIPHGRDLARVEASGWETSKGSAVGIEVGKKHS